MGESGDAPPFLPSFPPPPPPAGPVPPAPSGTSSSAPLHTGSTRTTSRKRCARSERGTPHQRRRSSGTPTGGRYGSRPRCSLTGTFVRVTCLSPPTSERRSAIPKNNTTDVARGPVRRAGHEAATGSSSYFGGIPITLTPAPRATSIACTTSWYFTVGSPFTNMILLGRPS